MFLPLKEVLELVKLLKKKWGSIRGAKPLQNQIFPLPGEGGYRGMGLYKQFKTTITWSNLS